MLVRGSNPKWFFNKLDGTVLQPPATISFLENTAPYLPKMVYQDIDRTIPWGQPINIDTAGSIPDNIYLDPIIPYRIEVREGPGQNDPLVFPPIENYSVDGDGSNPDNSASSGKTDNQITNPQFNLVNFSNGDTITVAGTYNIAPGWFLLLSGSGTTTLNQVGYAGSEQFDNNPPYALQIINSGWSQATLFQQFSNGGLFSGSAVSFSALMRADIYITPITVNYVDSANITTTLFNDNLAFAYTTYPGAKLIPKSTNPNLPPTGFTKLQFLLPINGTVLISNVQLIGSAKPIEFAYEETTPERQIDQTFHIYKNELLIKPKDSILTGWDFAVNPWQFSPSGQTAAPLQTQYVCDNTVLYQRGASGNIETYRLGSNMPPDGLQGLQINPTPTAGAGAAQFALITYIDPKTMGAYWGQYVSSLIRARLYSTLGTKLTCKMRLIYRASEAPVLSANEPISTWTGKDPVFSLGWNAITPLNDPEYTVPNSFDSTLGQSAFPAFAFNEFLLPQQQTTSDTLALVFYTTSALAPSATSPDVFVIQRGSLVPNRFAVDSNPQTFDESLKRCELYYEKSYLDFVMPGTATILGSQFRNTPVYLENGNWTLYQNSFQLRYKTKKIVTPTTTFYAPVASTVDSVEASLLFNSELTPGTSTSVLPVSNWKLLNNSNTSLEMICSTGSSPIIVGTNMIGQEGIFRFHYTADARIGVVL